MLTPQKIEEIKKEVEGLNPEEQQKKIQEILVTLSPEEREQLVGKQQCPFCLMGKGQIPVKTVYEDDSLMAVLDINPANKGHVILFPKDHSQVLAQVADDLVGHMFIVANKIATGLFDALGADGTNIVVSNGLDAGQTSPHTIVNIIPRYKDDKVAIAWQGQKVEDAEMVELAEKIKAKIPSGERSVPKVIKKIVDPENVPRKTKRIP
ncbi:MAG: HIT family protein [Nanoarchaeota archaeon]|nr:HIT family protein [Nanoarchaeota archaeon]